MNYKINDVTATREYIRVITNINEDDIAYKITNESFFMNHNLPITIFKTMGEYYTDIFTVAADTAPGETNGT